MKFLYILAVFCIPIPARSQSTPYKNLEKYWFYRYRLVNDFMKIGRGLGESIPAQQRTLGGDSPNDESDPNSLKFEEGTIALGTYIGVLATEHRQLDRYAYSKNRTAYELDLALAALERLDQNSNWHSERNWLQTDTQAYPKPPPPGYTELPDGFFLRDDVRWEHLVEDNEDHFNRPALKDDDRGLRHVSISAHRGSYRGVSTDPPDADYPNTYNPPGSTAFDDWDTDGDGDVDGSDHFRAPNEESQDQMVGLSAGLALVITEVDDGFLQARAAGNYFRLATHAGTHSGLSFDVITPSSAFASNWIIHNPAHPAWSSVGSIIAPKHWVGGATSSPLDAGAYVGVNASGMIRAAKKLTDAYVHGVPWLSWETKVSSAQWAAYELASTPAPSFIEASKDWHFPATFAVYAKDWGPFGWATWNRIRNGAVLNCFQNPHLPLMFRLYHHGVGSGLGSGPSKFSPETKSDGCCGYVGDNYPTYPQLLDAAPPCGPFSYTIGGVSGNYWMGHDYGWEWSGSDRLSEPYHRWDNTPDIACGSSVWGWEGLGPGKYPCAKKFCQNSDFNGLDYMLLFNLYSLVKGDYIGLFFNSYYEEALATSYPHGSAGAAPSRLMLNYLEYLRLINKINPDARVTFRGGKTIELKPGFEAKYGSQTLLHIKDYNCDNRLDGVDDRYHFAEFTNGAGNVITHIDYTPYMGTPSDVPARIGEEEEEGYTDEQADSIMNSPALKAYEASLIDTIYASGDEMAIAALERMRGSNPAARARAAARHLEILPTFTADLHPNPTTGFFTLHTSAPATYEVTVFTTLGVKISEHTFTGTEAHLSLPPSTPPGNYTVFVQGPTTRTALKLTVVP